MIPPNDIVLESVQCILIFGLFLLMIAQTNTRMKIQKIDWQKHRELMESVNVRLGSMATKFENWFIELTEKLNIIEYKNERYADRIVQNEILFKALKNELDTLGHAVLKMDDYLTRHEAEHVDIERKLNDFVLTWHKEQEIHPTNGQRFEIIGGMKQYYNTPVNQISDDEIIWWCDIAFHRENSERIAELYDEINTHRCYLVKTIQKDSPALFKQFLAGGYLFDCETEGEIPYESPKPLTED